MNWHNLSNQDFDANIKRHVDNTSVPFDPQSWNKMSKKLDGLPPGSNSNGTGSYVLLIVILLLATLFFWNIRSFPKTDLVSHTNVIDQISNNATQPEKLAPNSENETNNSGQDSHNNKISNNATQPEKSASNSENETNNSKQDSHNNKISNNSTQLEQLTPHLEIETSNATQQSHKEEIPKASHGNTINSETRSGIKIGANNTSGPTVLIAGKAQGSTFESSKGYAANSQEESSIVTNQAERSKNLVSPHGPSIKSSLQIMVPGLIEDSVILAVEQPPVIESTSSPWVAGFSYAPDLSMVGSSGVSKPGTNLFLSLEYKLNSRWSLQSGVAYSRKFYQATGADYNPPEGFWDYGMVPDVTDATCDIIDIPINLRYYINPSKRNRFFASTGISSYLMLTEEYYYHYEDDYGPNLVEEWNVNNENRHFFSIYNLSIGYQRSVGDGWSLEVEPFAKVPLAGVGFAEVDLWSTGAWFSVKYNFK